MVSVTFQYYAKCMNGAEELELLVANNQDNKKIIKRLKDNPKLYDNVWLTRHASAGYSESNRCSLAINTTGFTEEQMVRGRWKKVIALRKEKTETIITSENIF